MASSLFNGSDLDNSADLTANTSQVRRETAIETAAEAPWPIVWPLVQSIFFRGSSSSRMEVLVLKFGCDLLPFVVNMLIYICQIVYVYVCEYT